LGRGATFGSGNHETAWLCFGLILLRSERFLHRRR
jgi:hypothetical protein